MQIVEKRTIVQKKYKHEGRPQNFVVDLAMLL